MPEGVAPSWEAPQQEMPTMTDANFSSFDTKSTRNMRNMMSFDVDSLRMGGRGFCSGSLAGDKTGAKAATTAAETTITR